MYYLVFGCLYLLSLLPWRIIYLLSDFAFLITYYLIRYRRKVVAENLLFAFPDKTDAERRQIAIKFYRRFCDTWLETIKLLTVSKDSLLKRVSGDTTIFENLYAEGRSVQANLGHFINWEIFNISMGIIQPYQFLGVYFPQSNKTADRLMKYIRGRWGNVLIPSTDIARSIIPWRKKQYYIGLGGDQSAPPSSSYWLNFMNRPAPFVKGPEKFARGQQLPVVMATITQPRRGYYRFDFFLTADHTESLPEGELMRRYVRNMEKNIRLQPELYLWSHRRWKHAWQPAYAAQWVDDQPMPASR
ncbi:MAG TPA: lysophospholipid acyltransferase family protein [Sediminibacterium sp.]|nr:lysophospholipid acyltransferase family protein [Sediminibacterium sp.]